MLFNQQSPVVNTVKKQYLNVFNDFIKILMYSSLWFNVV